MLCLSLYPHNTIIFDLPDNKKIEVRLGRVVRRGRVQLVIAAPASVTIHRGEKRTEAENGRIHAAI